MIAEDGDADHLLTRPEILLPVELIKATGCFYEEIISIWESMVYPDALRT
jgi:hypothetical protein